MRPRFLIHILLMAVFGLIAAGCTHTPDPRLLRAESMMTDSLPQARAMLDSIDRTSLSEADRNLRDLLTIKAADKSELKISNGAIDSVLDYYSKNGDLSRYAEACYYKGRMYCQDGDYPAALRYFRTALDIIPDKKENLYLRGLILSQSGRRLNQMRIYNEADSFLNESIKIDHLLKDTTGLIYDLELSGAINIHAKNYDKAEKLFKEAMKLAQNRSLKLEMRQKMYLAAVLYERGDKEGALSAIRGIPEQISDTYKATALGYAADIYLANHILDTACLYAIELEGLEKANNRKSAYRVLLSPQAREILPKDSIAAYTSRYTAVMENFVSNNGSASAVIQNANFNYKTHENAKTEAESAAMKNAVRLRVVICLLFVIVIIATFLFIKNKRAQQYVKDTRKKMMLLRRSFFQDYNSCSNTTEENLVSREELRTQLLHELLEDSGSGVKLISEELLMSEVYLAISGMCTKNTTIPSHSPLWKNLEKTVNGIYVDFTYRVRLLLAGEFTDDKLKHMLLIKCGFNSKQVAVLVAKTPGAINYRRKKLAQAIFGDEEKVELLDLVIQRL